jgi:hypothetical protein
MVRIFVFFEMFVALNLNIYFGIFLPFVCLFFCVCVCVCVCEREREREREREMTRVA